MKYQYLEAPNHPGKLYIRDWSRSIFLGGSITGAMDWQKDAAAKLLPHFNVFNPRRENFDVTDKDAEHIQISWEHQYLSKVEVLLFYFDHATLAPITLLEYGAALESSKISTWQHVYAAIHPDYKRKNDVVIQTELRNPKWVRNISFNLNDTIDKIIHDYGPRPVPVNS